MESVNVLIGHMLHPQPGLGVLEIEKGPLDVRETCVHILGLLGSVAVCPRANLYLSEPQFPHLSSADASRTSHKVIVRVKFPGQSEMHILRPCHSPAESEALGTGPGRPCIRICQVIQMVLKPENCCIKALRPGRLVAQSVEHLTVDFGSGRDPSVVGSSSTSGSMLSVEPA